MQEEELEVLKSIYEGDEAFVILEEGDRFQYKYGEDGAAKSFLVELRWPKEYPECAPDVSLSAFYNEHVVSEVKEAVSKAVEEEAENYLGMSMTYSLLEMIKERQDEFLALQPEEVPTTIKQAEERVEKLTIEGT